MSGGLFMWYAGPNVRYWEGTDQPPFPIPSPPLATCEAHQQRVFFTYLAVLSCLILSCLVLSCLVLSCLFVYCRLLSCLVLYLSCNVSSCLVLSCLVSSCLFLSRRVLLCLQLVSRVLPCLVLSHLVWSRLWLVSFSDLGHSNEERGCQVRSQLGETRLHSAV